MADSNKKSVNFLPDYLQTDKNKKFLSSTLDELLQNPELERIDGYVGSKLTPTYDPVNDVYLQDIVDRRSAYQFEPALIFKDIQGNVTDSIFYEDILNRLTIEGAFTENLDRLFNTVVYSYAPPIDFDKFSNYDQYYWLPNGPDPIVIPSEDFINRDRYTFTNGIILSNGMKVITTTSYVSSGTYISSATEYIVEGVGGKISLVKFDNLVLNSDITQMISETFDSFPFDYYGFDSSNPAATVPEYVTINRGSRDLNPWSRYNRWFHADIIAISAQYNNTLPLYDYRLRAKRPIVEFAYNLKLFNFGLKSVGSIDLYDDNLEVPLDTITGNIGFYIDGVPLDKNYRVIFNANQNVNDRKKIYIVNFTTGTNLIYFTEDVNVSVIDNDSISVNLGVKYKGKSFHYNDTDDTWVESQNKTKLNQAPLFDLYDSEGIGLNDISAENNFSGTKLFGYKIGSGKNDEILGFPISVNQNLVGISSFQFENYQGTESINFILDGVSVEKSVEEYFFKQYRIEDVTYVPFLRNLYGTSFQLPQVVIESFITTESTNSFKVSAFDNPVYTPTRTFLSVNDRFTTSSFTVTSFGIVINSSRVIAENNFVTLRTISTQTPNSNGYYAPVISLQNNPFNEKISTITYSQLVDHIETIVFKDTRFRGVFPGRSNLRDRPPLDWGLGNRIIMNENPISFLQLFLGKSDVNVINSIRWVGNQYNFFKQNLLRKIELYNYTNDPVAALDNILLELGTTKFSNQSFYNSDMVGFGNVKFSKEYIIVSQIQKTFPLPDQFDLTRLSYKAFYIYYSGRMLIYGIDYSLNYNNGTFTILVDNSQWLIGNKFTINYYSNTLGNFIAPTPTKLGLYPATKPIITTDNRYSYGSVNVIVGHDGSIIKAFNDFRDTILLEYELRVYNNLKIHYSSNIFNIFDKIPGSFRTTNFNKDEFNGFLEKEYSNWAVKNGIEVGKNTTFDNSNTRTHNFKNVIDNIINKVHNGTYRSILKDLYDTDRPHSHPWECLNFAEKPIWWDSVYTGNYSSTNTTMWTDIFNGFVREPGNNRVINYLIRSSGVSLAAQIPADSSGNLRPIESFLVNESESNRDNSWIFGDHSPAEVAWRQSSIYPYALQICMILISPLDYMSRLFDVSRISINSRGQFVWKEDNLFLSPKKLLVEAYDVDSAAGYGNFILEYGTFIDKDYRKELSQNIANLDSNLAYKLGGYSTKEKLKVLINAVDPDSNSPGLVLPNEDYTIKLYKSDPIKQFDISGIIVQKIENGYAIKGYNRYNSYFKIFKPIYSNNSKEITIGGIPEPYSIWQPYYGDEKGGLSSVDIATAGSYTSKFYKKGQLVFYNSRYYRVIVSHSADRIFQSEFFTLLDKQPSSGGVTVQHTDVFENQESIIFYGATFANAQQVYDVIIGYGQYLESLGFIFDNYNRDLLEIINWNFSAKEFLYWSSQNWATGNLITLSPFSDKIKFFSKNYVVEDLFKENVEYNLQNADGKFFPKENIDVVRNSEGFTIFVKNTEDGLFFASLKIIQKEHILVLNNTTVFNDTIFDKPTGYKQFRIKLTGFKTKNWNGDLSNPGFLFYPGDYTDWEPYAAYTISDIVRFNGQYYQANENIQSSQTFNFDQWSALYEKYDNVLLPNFEYKINQFEDFYSLDIDNFDFEQQKFAQHLIGYSPRPYLDKIITDPVAQYKFYQGFIKDKGTIKALENILKVGKNKATSSIEIQEEWAVRVGEYGSISSVKEIEFELRENQTVENPYVVSFSNSQSNNKLIQYNSTTDFLILPTNIDIENVFSTASNTVIMGTAGYVRQDDITGTAYNKNSLLDIANNSLIKNGDTIWLGFLENGGWDVYRYLKQKAKITGVFVQSPGSSITFVTSGHHNLIIGDIISVVGFNYQVNGVYIVQEIPNLTQFTVASRIVGIENDELIAYGSLLKFEKARFQNYQDWNSSLNQFNLSQGDKVWIDNDENGKWVVLEKIQNISLGSQYKTAPVPLNQKLGSAIFASTLTNIVIVSSLEYNAPGTINYGAVGIYRKDFNNNLNKLFSYPLNSTQNYVQMNTSTDFGYSLNFDISKELIFAGAPKASNIRATTSTSQLVSISSQTFNSRGYMSEGVVKISTLNIRNTGELTKVVLTQPYNTLTNSNSRFGHSIYINQTALTSSTTLLIGAPGNARHIYSGKVFAYKVNLLNVDILDFNIDNFVEAYRGSYGFNDFKNVALSILPFYVSNNVYNTSNGIRYGLYRDPDSDGLDYWVRNVINNGYDSNSLAFIDLFFSAVDAQPLSFDYARSFTNNKLYQRKGTIDIVPFFGTNTIEVVSTSSVVINGGAKWGYQIAGDRFGNTIAISAPNYFDNGAKGIVQIFDNNLNWKQTIISPFTSSDEFGTTVVVSDTGKFLFVGSRKASYDRKTLGRVAVYKKQSDLTFSLNQIISNPIQNSDLIFAQDIDISENEQMLAITALGTNKSEVVKFYKTAFNRNTETTFDSNQTRFITVVPDSGSTFIYQNLNDYFIGATELLPEDINQGSDYGYSVNITNNEIYVGAPTIDFISSDTDISSFYKFNIIDKNKKIWNRLRYEEDLVDVSKINKVSRISLENEEVIDYLDIYDPIKGRIPGIADQEIKYKLSADPAVYSIGIGSTVVDNQINWIDPHIGELWWDLSSAKYIWYEQGNEIYRKNNWGKLFPGASIDIYEWVRSTLLPSEWAAIADTTKGITKGISGQPKYPDNSVMSVKQVLNTITGAFENVYFYWVKNKTIVPEKTSRRISAIDVSRLIADPVGYGHRFIEIISKNSIAVANLGSSVNESLNINYSDITNDIPKHTEWVLMREGDITSVPNAYLEKKIFDSMVGRDTLGNLVPDPNLSFRNRYGLSIRPQQTIFKNRFEAIRNIFSFVNSTLSENRTTSIYDFTKLLEKESAPIEESGEYDYLVAEYNDLNLIRYEKFKQARVSVTVNNGKIVSVNIIDPGYGYKFSPKIVILPNKDASLSALIDAEGRIVDIVINKAGNGYTSSPTVDVRSHTVLVEIDSQSANRWSLYSFNYSLNSWNKIRTQLYNTSLYWDYVDFQLNDYDPYKSYVAILNDVFELSSLTDLKEQDYIKVANIGNGNPAVLRKVSNNVSGNYSKEFDIVYERNGTIKFKDVLWNKNTNYGFSATSLDETLFDQLPDVELFNILSALKNDIFTEGLKVYWNKFFFTVLKYVISEQYFIDWAFKTSFVIVKSSTNYLDQRPAYSLDSSKYIEDYINEIKPFKTTVRNFNNVNNYLENSNSYFSDFDVPAFYNKDLERYDTIRASHNQVWSSYSSSLNTGTVYDWYQNRYFTVKEIYISDGGSGYTNKPTVVFIGDIVSGGYHARAEAYVRNGSVYKVEVIDPGYGYRSQPQLSFTNGGAVTRHASGSVIIENRQVRSNTIGIKFDRYTRSSELGNRQIIFETVTNGSQIEFELPYKAEADKLSIFVTLNKKIVLGSNYRIEHFSKDTNKFAKNYSKFIFVNFIPPQGQFLKIVFNKHIDLYSAIDRIEEFYQPTVNMVEKSLPLLIKGLEYPYTQFNGLKFDYSPPLGQGSPLGWNDLTNNYAKSKLRSQATVSDRTLALESIQGIVPGQILTLLGTTSNYFRTDTVVQSVNSITNTIDITIPVYEIANAVSTSTALGSYIRIDTRQPFNGALRTGDQIQISGVVTGGFNGRYTIYEINDNNTFVVTATSILSAVTANFITATVTVCSILNNIAVNNRVLGSINFQIGPCFNEEYILTARSPAIMEGYTATFTLSGLDLYYGTGKTIGYLITGTNITSGDFAGGLTGTISTSVTSLPLNFSITTLSDGTVESTETFYVSVYSYLTSGTVNTYPVATTSMKLRDRPTGPPAYYISAYKNGNLVSSPVNEGDIISYVISATNVDFGSDGRILQVIGSGTNITTGDITAGVLTATSAPLYSLDELPISFDVQISEDLLTEGTENFSVYLKTWLNVLEVTSSTFSTSTTITINDTSFTNPPSYTLTSNSPVGEGSIVTITLTTLNLPNGYQVPYSISTVTGNISLADLSTSSYVGTLTLITTAIPTQASVQKQFNIAVDALSEPTETFRFTLPTVVSSIGMVYGQSYIDVSITDQVVNEFGQTPSRLVSKTVNNNVAFGRIVIESSGTFNLSIQPIDAAYGSGVYVTPYLQRWAIDSTGLTGLYVRARLDPLNEWSADVSFTGPGFGSIIDVAYLNTYQYNQVNGSWVTIATAASTPVNGQLGWYASANYTGVGPSVAKFNLTIEISTSTSGVVIASGTYYVEVDAQTTVFDTVFLDPAGELSDARLKSDIKKIGIHQLGFGLYEYMLFDKKEQGVLAQEVMLFNPDAVNVGKDGYYRVNYNKLDISRMKNSLGDIILRESPPRGFVQ